MGGQVGKLMLATIRAKIILKLGTTLIEKGLVIPNICISCSHSTLCNSFNDKDILLK
jgi:hypothetical protein